MAGEAKRTSATAKLVALALLSIGGAIAFALVSATINGQPAMRPFDGWIVVLEPAGAPVGDAQVMLAARPVVAGGSGDHPRLTYSVSVCGRRPFHAVLVIGGDARLEPIPGEPQLVGATTLAGSSQRRVQTVPRMTFESVSSGHAIPLGPVQMVPLRFDQPPRCVARFSPDHRAGFSGQALTMTGRAAAAVERDWSAPFNWWSGPRTSQVWPLIGTIPGVPLTELGVFHGVEGLRGDWRRPLRQYFAVDVGALTSKTSVELARPEPSESTALSWRNNSPITPIARVVNTDALTMWQQRLVLATIWLSIGASLLAALVLARLRSRGQGEPPSGLATAPHADATSSAQLGMQGASPASTDRRTIQHASVLALLVGVVVGGYRWLRR